MGNLATRTILFFGTLPLDFFFGDPPPPLLKKKKRNNESRGDDLLASIFYA
jgi:hypothetical protein